MIVLVSLIALLRGFPCFYDFSHLQGDIKGIGIHILHLYTVYHLYTLFFKICDETDELERREREKGCPVLIDKDSYL